MKNHFLIMAMMMLSVTFAFSQSSYYYYRGNKLFIQEDSRRVSVVALKGKPLQRVQATPLNTKQPIVIHDAQYTIVVYEMDATNIGTGSSGALRTAVRSIYDSNTLVLPCYKNVNGDELAMTNYLNIKLKQTGDFGKLQTIAAQYHLDNLKQNEFMPLWYSLTITPQSPGTTLEVANAIFETGLFASSFADFSFDGLECSYDPDFSKQWGLYNGEYEDIDISICNAWNYSTGRGIKIAIVDQGIENTHSELASNIYSSYDTETGTLSNQVYGSHGTHCAGIAAAIRNNGVNIAGVAPDAKLMAVSNKLKSDTNLPLKLANGINWAWKNGADIISCSWWCEPNDIVADAIDEAIDNGREGKGVIFVKSAGNNYGGPISWPGNYRSEVLAIGSIDKNGIRSAFSSIGSAIDVVAPGGSVDIFLHDFT